MSKYELQKLFFKKLKKLLMTSFSRSRSRSWSRTLLVSVSKPKLRSRPVLVSEKFRGLDLGLGLGRVGLDYSPVSSNSCPLNLLLVQSLQAEIIIVKRLVQGRNNVTRVRVEPRSFDRGRRKNDA